MHAQLSREALCMRMRRQLPLAARPPAVRRAVAQQRRRADCCRPAPHACAACPPACVRSPAADLKAAFYAFASFGASQVRTSRAWACLLAPDWCVRARHTCAVQTPRALRCTCRMRARGGRTRPPWPRPCCAHARGARATCGARACAPRAPPHAQRSVEMEGKNFIKLCKDTKLMGKALSSTDIDLIFTKVREGGWGAHSAVCMRGGAGQRVRRTGACIWRAASVAGRVRQRAGCRTASCVVRHTSRACAAVGGVPHAHMGATMTPR
jgi:hypothetical protein